MKKNGLLNKYGLLVAAAMVMASLASCGKDTTKPDKGEDNASTLR